MYILQTDVKLLIPCLLFLNNSLVLFVTSTRPAIRTHLYDHAQVSDVHPLRLDDLHDHTVQVGQLGSHDEGLLVSGWSLFVFVIIYEAQAPPPLVKLLSRVQVVVRGLSRKCRGGVFVSGGS